MQERWRVGDNRGPARGEVTLKSSKVTVGMVAGCVPTQQERLTPQVRLPRICYDTKMRRLAKTGVRKEAPMSTCIVVIEDDPACRELLHDLLSEEGYAVHLFPDSDGGAVPA
jgi:transposase